MKGRFVILWCKINVKLASKIAPYKRAPGNLGSPGGTNQAIAVPDLIGAQAYDRYGLCAEGPQALHVH